MVRIIPPKVTDDINRGEADFRDILEKSFLKKNYIALHSVGLTSHSRKAYAEVDFLLITEMGIVCLEVKGGDVILREDGIWTIGHHASQKYYMSHEGPFKQAAGTVGPITKQLNEGQR